MIKSILLRLYGYYARFRINVLAALAWWKTRKQKPVVHFQTARQPGQPILLAALYEKGVLRPDTRRLIEAARERGAYVLVSNTMRIADLTQLDGLVDCYIERPNFGRDFGSYKTAFTHLFEQGWHQDCPRLLMLNDSIFYTSQGLDAFLDAMFGSEQDVLGSTENFEHEYHLGSFCISMSGRVLRDPRFRKYWNDYTLSDIRPTVIQTGELAFSRVLKACAASPTQISALFGASRYIKTISKDDELVDFTLTNHLVSPRNPWRRVSPQSTIASLLVNHFASVPSLAQQSDLMRRARIASANLAESPSSRVIATGGAGSDPSLDVQPVGPGGSDSQMIIGTIADMRQLLRREMADDDPRADRLLHDYVIGALSEVFLHGSQIHQNAIVLLKMGLPIVKLDGLYRGIFNVVDMHRISSQLPEDEAAELEGLLLERPYGGDTYYGWRKMAYRLGYL
ncbi:hypothetical protein MLD63_12065 [Paracoccus sp. TK19116]|uniref:Rhamnan synthesis protein F n=1 Tax=Paracoccus albicereus TaxID=2922394 RepID=A0ABT1MS85_9RHOB|nr:hypothetical protein [Paracoccus albicereus]MCQ0971158.1 hypothetical protein [Paracoccus albicereus]